VIRRVTRAIRALRPGHPVGVRRRGGVVVVSPDANAWPALFPQHGPGQKHTRPIVLASWQAEVIRANRVTISIARRPDVARLDRLVEYDNADHPPPTLREALRAYRSRSNVGSGLPA
jgi:hypothetical protein